MRRRRRPAEIIEGNRVTLLRDGQEAFPAMLRAIAGAKRYLHVEVFTIRDDAVGRSFAEAFIERARAGVEVRVFFDEIGCLTTPVSFFGRMRDAGVQIASYQPIAPWKRKWGIYRRDHRKIVVVDGEVGFLGGLNLELCHAPCDQGGAGWRDAHVEVKGPAVAEIDRFFLNTWRRHAPPALRPKLLPYLSPAVPAGRQAVQVLGQPVTVLGRSPIRRAYVAAIAGARKRIWIANPYFLPDARLIRLLVHAVKRGVDVRVMVPAASDVRIVDLAARPIFRHLVKQGVRVFHYTRAVLHAKTAVVDDAWSTVGSFNLDPMSFKNLEMNVVVHDAGFNRELAGSFVDDLQHTVELKPGTEPFPAYMRVFEWTFHGMRDWL